MQFSRKIFLSTAVAITVMAVELPRWHNVPAPVADHTMVEVCAAHGKESYARLRETCTALCGRHPVEIQKSSKGYLLVAKGVSTTANAFRLARVANEFVKGQAARQTADALRTTEIARTRLAIASESVSPHHALAQARNRQAWLESEISMVVHECRTAEKQLQAVRAVGSDLTVKPASELPGLKAQRTDLAGDVLRWEKVAREGHPGLIVRREELAALDTRIENIHASRISQQSEWRAARLKDQAFLSARVSRLKSDLASLEVERLRYDREVDLAMERIVRDREILGMNWKPLAVAADTTGNTFATLSPAQPEKAPRGMSSSVLSLGASY